MAAAEDHIAAAEDKIAVADDNIAAAEDKIEERETPELLKASKLEAIVKECFISPSQEEILQRIAHSNHNSPQLSPATTSYSQPSSRDFFTVGAHKTIFYSPDETQLAQDSDVEEDSFDSKFESDRDESLSLNTQCLDITKSVAIFNSNLRTPPERKSQSALQLQEAASANSKFCNSTLPEDKAMAKPSLCRRRLIGPSEEVKTSAKSPPDLEATETLAGSPQPNNQVNCNQLLDSHDFDQLDTQAFHCLGPIETSDLAVAPKAGKLAEADEIGQGKSSLEEIRARRTLPPFFLAAQKGISASSCLERDSSAPTSLEKEVFAPTSLEKEISAPKALNPKRQDKVAVAKPYPETLMDVIMHYSGEPPEGYQDADVLEAAIKAGITFPPPLSRLSFCK